MKYIVTLTQTDLQGGKSTNRCLAVSPGIGVPVTRGLRITWSGEPVEKRHGRGRPKKITGIGVLTSLDKLTQYLCKLELVLVGELYYLRDSGGPLSKYIVAKDATEQVRSTAKSLISLEGFYGDFGPGRKLVDWYVPKGVCAEVRLCYCDDHDAWPVFAHLLGKVKKVAQDFYKSLD